MLFIARDEKVICLDIWAIFGSNQTRKNYCTLRREMLNRF